MTPRIFRYVSHTSLSRDADGTQKFSVVLVVPDHGDRFYIQEMTSLLLGSMGFKEIAIHQVSYYPCWIVAAASAKGGI